MDYDYVPISQRQPLKSPNGARVALILTFILETWNLTRDTKKGLLCRWPGDPDRGADWSMVDEIADCYLANHQSHIPR